MLQIRQGADLTADDRDAVLALADRAQAHDGSSPLPEQVRLDLRPGASNATHVLLHTGDGLVGYAQPAAVGADAGELVVDPDARRRGHGRELLDALRGLSDRGLSDRGAGPGARVWAHGGLDSATAFAAATGMHPVRELLTMTRPLTDDAPPLPDVRLPDGIAVDTWTADDARDWVQVNALAFADHPEQGSWTVQDLARRVAEDWFDPAGLFLARDREGTLVAFHWTKTSRVDDRTPPDADPTRHGEVYVVAVSPQAQGGGLGKAMALVGLHHLRDTGCRDVSLYVEGDNGAARAVYERLGFARSGADLVYADPGGLDRAGAASVGHGSSPTG